MTRFLSTTHFFFDRRFLVANAILAGGIALVAYFPAEGAAADILLTLAGFALLPAIFVHFILKESFREYGLHFGTGKIWFLAAILLGMLAIALGAAWLFLAHTEAGARYVELLNIAPLRRDFLVFLTFLSLSAVKIFCMEAFFRGFFLHVWRRIIGAWSILAAILAAILFFFLTSSAVSDPIFSGQFLLFIVGALIATLIAFISRSFLLPFCFSFFFDTLTTVFIMTLS